jgi:Methyltransferase domain
MLLAEAARRAGEGEWSRFVQADYRELPFADAGFDCVANLFTSLGYWGEDGDRRRSRSSGASCGRAGSSSSRRCTATG